MNSTPLHAAGPQRRPAGFTLIELMVVISTISLLGAILLPALRGAVEYARARTCGANLRAAAVAVQMQSFNLGGVFPPAWTAQADGGKSTWSGLLAEQGYLDPAALLCPSCEEGGLPAANPASADLAAGQRAETPGALDLAPRRCAFTVNEALMPSGRVPLRRPCRAVKLEEASPSIILATEFAEDWRLLGGGETCPSYTPVHGFYVLSAPAGNKYNLSAAGKTGSKPCLRDGPYSRVALWQLQANPVVGRINPSPLDTTARRHGGSGAEGFGGANFAFVDGHVELLCLPDTLGGKAWGELVYSASGDNRVH